MVHITQHACERYVERIEPRLTHEEAHARIMLSASAIKVAADFGCRVVRTSSGAKLILRGESVVTVIVRGWIFSEHFPTIGACL